ncbi:hypothetical protein MDA_GLEAN10013018 [Myotis davidii]|uniref:Uncharacterized protein n=1 Tax=Myotis davidii TaxID=225400 RepID=L5LPE0_MYODS|nr:hypothetical protein MDA_GLEAN10013018 [Myotis davidii]
MSAGTRGLRLADFSDLAASGDHTDISFDSRAPRILCIRGHSPRPGSERQALWPPFRGGGSDQSAGAEGEVGVTSARGGAETAEGAVV